MAVKEKCVTWTKELEELMRLTWTKEELEELMRLTWTKEELEELMLLKVLLKKKKRAAEHQRLELLQRKHSTAGYGGKKSVTGNASTSSPRGNTATYADSVKGTHGAHALASIPTIRSGAWIVDSGASRHVTGASSEFSSYTHLASPESIQTADGTAQPVVSKGTVRCTDSMTLTNVLHAPSFSVNLVSISDIISEQKCIVTFDIPKMVFQENGTGRILGTGTWRDGLWYMDREGMDTALTSVVNRVWAGGSGVSVEDELILIHQRMRHSSFSLLERLHPSKYEKADKQKLVCDGCEFRKHTRSSYVSSGSRSSHAFDLVHSDVYTHSSKQLQPKLPLISMKKKKTQSGGI